MGRRLDWLVKGTPWREPDVSAAAGRVALAARPGALALGSPFSPPLAGFDPPYPFADCPPWFDRAAAMSVASISRCRDLICNAIGQLPFTAWQLDPNTVPVVEKQIPGPGWIIRPDPNRTRQWLLAWTTDDLIFYGVAHWEIVDRYATTYPSVFQRIEPGSLQDNDGRWTITDPVSGKTRDVNPADIVEFLSPVEAMLSNGWRTISIALQLDQAANRFAAAEIPAGVLQEQDGSEDMSAGELAEVAASFSAARQSNTTAALNKYLRYEPTPVDASTMQIVEGRSYQALEAARLGNVPPYLVGAPAGTGMTYQNGLQARQDLIDFGASAYIGCIEQTLSGPNVTPRNQLVRLDLNAWLRNPFTSPASGSPSPNDAQIAVNQTPEPDQ